VRRSALRECARVLKPGGRLIIQDSLQHNDQRDYEGLLQLFPQNYHEPYYASFTKEDFGTLGLACGLAHVRSVMAFVSKIIGFHKGINRYVARPSLLPPQKSLEVNGAEAFHTTRRTQVKSVSSSYGFAIDFGVCACLDRSQL
jgi:ubiquinone/menaquinone biosynthesis C-methylase UbiE